MAEIARKTKRYPTDLTDEEWERIRPLLPKASRRGRKPKTDMREVMNAIRYMARSGGGWRMLPKEFGPWQTIYWWFRRFVRRLLFRTIHDVALMIDRERCGREASPTAGVLDSQTIKAPQAQTRGYDANKKIVGRKRHVAVDTDGRHRDRAQDQRRARLQGPAAALGGGAHLRLDDPLAPPSARLRAAPRRLRSLHPRRHGKPTPTPHH